MPMMTDQEWQAQVDAETIAAYDELIKDPQRVQRAREALEQRAKKAADDLKRLEERMNRNDQDGERLV